MSTSPSEAFFAPCPRGLEALLAAELAPLGAREARAVPGGVAFRGGWEACYAANLWSRIASRILWRIAEFGCRDERELYAAVRAVDWRLYFAVERSLRVSVAARRSPLKSLDFAVLRVKDAICDRFRDALGRRPDVNRTEPDVRVHLYLEGTRAALYLDTSGEALFKRGWRAARVEAPLRENLAAGIIMLTGWRPHEPLLDPLCGGGTLLLEAAAMARGRAPGGRRRFGFEKLASYDPAAWARVRASPAYAAPAAPAIYGRDIDATALAAARRNLAAAGLERWVKLERADVLERPAPVPSGVLVANPPYGERLGSKQALAGFYPRLGDALKRGYAGWRCYVFTADRELPARIRLAPSRRIPLWNGALECRLYEFRMVAGSNRRPAPATRCPGARSPW